MTSTYVSTARPNSSNRVGYRRLYEFPDNDSYNLTSPIDDDIQAIGWDRRYGIIFFSEAALLYGPFSISSADEQHVFSQVQRFMQERGKKCQYRIYETYTGVKIGKSGLRVRPRDPATDRVYYFPSHFPNCVILSVLHFDGDSSSTCAVLIYRFKSPEIASRAYTMLTETNSVPKRGRSSKLLRKEVMPQLSRSSPNRMPVSRTPSNMVLKDKNIFVRNRSVERDVQLAAHSRMEQSFIDLNGRRSKLSSPIPFKRTESKRRSSSNPKIKAQRSMPMKPLTPYCCCSVCGHCSTDIRTNRQENGNMSQINIGSFILLNGKKYPVSLFKEIMAKDAEALPEFRLSRMKSTKQVSQSSSSCSDSIISITIDESSNQDINMIVENRNSDLNSESYESVVELVFDKLRKSTKTQENGTGVEGIGRTSTIVTRLSRQGYSDSEEGTLNGDHRGNGRLNSPSRVIPDGTTVQDLYGRQRYVEEGSESTLAEAF